jgi:hypothetical protein
VKIATCHICGTHTELTFEHVPPRAAFNNRPIKTTPFQALVSASDLDDPELRRKGKTSQRGAGAYTLCKSCNNDTGSWYGNAFVEWSYQGLEMRERAKIAPSLAFIFQIFPLRVFKQILCMFFSANPPNSFQNREELVRLVLNRDAKFLRPDIRIYAAVHASDVARQAGLTGQLNTRNGEIMLYSEIAFPPFTYVLTVNSAPPDTRLVDISFFSRYGYNQWTDIVLRLPALPVYTFLPGDYRSPEQARSEMLASARERAQLIVPK